MIPSMVLIAGMRYEVVEKEMKEEAQIIHSRQVIELNKDMSPEYKARVLLHEIIAGIYKEFGLPAAGKARNVNALTAGLWDFMRTNDMGFVGVNPPILNVIDNPVVIEPENVTEVFEELFADETHTLFPELTEPEPKVQVVSVEKYEHVDESIINEPDDSRFTLGEIARIKSAHKEVAVEVEEEEAPQPQEHWYTGIKIKEDGKKHYSTRYECPCGQKGKRYLLKEERICACHKCGTELFKKPATAKGFPDRDGFGNFFMAKRVFQR